MKISGIVCEYNPIHNGHIYHMEKTRAEGATHIVAVMSGNFVQRGDVAIINKFERAKTAVKCCVDLVIELPVAYSMANAETFARGAVHILDSLGCVDEISFGSECGSLERLEAAAEASCVCAENPELIELLENGMPYPVAIMKLVEKNYSKNISELFQGANNVLAIEYIKALHSFNSNIKPFTVQRMNVQHDQYGEYGGFASASYIRNNILLTGRNSMGHTVPSFSEKMINSALRNGSIANIKNLERILIYSLRTANIDALTEVPDVAHGLENRIMAASSSTSLEDVMNFIKTKRYPMSRIRRILLSYIIGIRKKDLEILPPYGRILAVNERGTEILSMAKGKSKIPFGTSLSKLGEIDENCKRYSELEAYATDIYSLASDNIKPSQTDYRAKIGLTNMTER